MGSLAEASPVAADSLAFRWLASQDLVQVKALNDALLQVKYGNTFYRSLLLEDRTAAVCVDGGGNVVGAASARGAQDEAAFETACAWFTGKRTGYVMTFGVDARFRRRGIGERLLQMVMDDLRNRPRCTHIALHCLVDNVPAIRMYQKQGFVVHRRLKGHYYFDGRFHDAYHMEALLNHPKPVWLLRAASYVLAAVRHGVHKTVTWLCSCCRVPEAPPTPKRREL